MRRRFSAVLLVGLLVLEASTSAPSAQTQSWLNKLGPVLQLRLTQPLGRSRVVVRATNSASVGPLTTLVQLSGGHVLQTLPVINALEMDLPNLSLGTVASSSLVLHMSVDRHAVGAMDRDANVHVRDDRPLGRHAGGSAGGSAVVEMSDQPPSTFDALVSSANT